MKKEPAMKTYISLLRGLGGKKTMPMAELRDCYEAMGLENVSTYIQSGNVIFSAPELDTAIWEEKIARQIETVFGFTLAVVLLEFDRLKQIAENNPLAGKDPKFLHVTFLFSPPARIDLAKLKGRSVEGEEFIVTDSAVYLYLPHGYARTKLNNNDLERILKVTASTRNWNTVNNLLQRSGGTGEANGIRDMYYNGRFVVGDKPVKR